MDVIIMDMGADMQGESATPGFEKKIELLSFSHGDAADRASGRREHKDMTVSKYLDPVSSPLLHRAAMEGKVFPQVDIIIGRNDAGRVAVLLRYIMKNVFVSAVSVSGGGGDKPVETVTLNFNSISWDYSVGER